MKKFLSIMACFVMVLVGGIALAGCGESDPFSKGETVDTNAVTEFVDATEQTNQFTTGFKLEMDINGIEMEAILTINEGKVEAYIDLEMAGTGLEEIDVDMWVKDDKIYMNSTQTGKVYIDADTTSAEYAEFLEQVDELISYKDDLSETIHGMLNQFSQLETMGAGIEVKKLVDGDSTRFRVKYADKEGEMYIIVGYKAGALVELVYEVEVESAGQETSMELSIKDYAGAVTLPSDIADYVYVPDTTTEEPAVA